MFAFSTLIGWSYYGETGIVYLFGTGATLPYRLLWLVFIYLGAMGTLHLVWDIADTLNGLMALPNLFSVLASIPILLKLKREFFVSRGCRDRMTRLAPGITPSGGRHQRCRNG